MRSSAAYLEIIASMAVHEAFGSVNQPVMSFQRTVEAEEIGKAIRMRWCDRAEDIGGENIGTGVRRDGGGNGDGLVAIELTFYGQNG
ncbi:hypothetical protein LINPERPRIM_LOCUS42507 [Linum perenne]